VGEDSVDPGLMKADPMAPATDVKDDIGGSKSN
jgi:hypothetical protein